LTNEKNTAEMSGSL